MVDPEERSGKEIEVEIESHLAGQAMSGDAMDLDLGEVELDYPPYPGEEVLQAISEGEEDAQMLTHYI